MAATAHGRGTTGLQQHNLGTATTSTLEQQQDPSLERSFRGHKDVITALSFKPSMSQLASASLDHSVMIWNFKPQLRAFRFVGHKGPVTSVDFSKNGNILASASRDKTVRLWTPNVKGDVTVFKAHTSCVRSVQFSSDSETLVTSSDDKSIKLWSTHRTKFQYTLTGHLNWVRSAVFSPDGQLVCSGSDDKTVKLWDLRGKSCVKTYWDHTGIVSNVAFHPSGTVIASCSMDRSIKLFDIRMHKLVQHYGEAHGASLHSSSLEGNSGLAGGVNSISFGGRNGEYLISTGMDGVIKIWDIKEGHLFYTLHGHKNGPTTTAVFSPHGDFFATGGSDSQVMVWKSNFLDGGSSGINAEGVEGDVEVSFGRVGGSTNTPNEQYGGGGVIGQAPVKHPRPKSSSPQRQESPQSKGPTSTTTTHAKATSAPIHHRVNVTNPESITVGASSSPVHGRQDFATSPLQVQQPVPDQISNTLSHIVRQLDILTQTMSILESRLTINEDRMMDIAQKIDGNHRETTQKDDVQSPSALEHVYFEEARAEELFQS